MRSLLMRLSLLAILSACSAPFAGDDANTGDDAAGDDAAGDDAGDDVDSDGSVADPDASVPDAAPPDARVPQVHGVCATGGDFTTIGAAVGAAFAGDTIEVCAGTYPERVVIDGKSLTVIGLGGAGATIVDAGGGGTGLTVRQTDGAGVTIQGLTIRNGATATQGGGIRCETSTLIVRDAVLTGNHAENGGGLYATGCTLDLTATRFQQNQGGELGGGALITESTGSIVGSHVIGNTAVRGAGLALIEGTVALDGNQIRNNVAALQGGGLYTASDSLVAHNTIADNEAGWTGGGIHIITHAPLMHDNVISGNVSMNDGGGVYAHQSAVTLRANTVTGNQAGDDGGGLRMFESPCTLEANLIQDNTTDDGGGGIRISHVPCDVIDNIVLDNYAGGTGGGMDLDNDASLVRGGQISNNRAGGSGGGIFAWLAPWTGTVIEDVLISGNHAWRGGGLFVDDNFTPVTMRRLTVVDNSAGLGGGLMVRATNFSVSDSLFARNEANSGGALYHAVNSMWWDECPCPPLAPVGTVEFVVFHANEADAGSAIWTNAAGLTIESSILYGHEGTAVSVTAPPDTPDVLTPPTWRYNDTSPATFVGMSDPTGSQGNLAVDPLFVGPGADDFHLQPASACVDAGNPQMLDTDGTRADMGMVGGTP